MEFDSEVQRRLVAIEMVRSGRTVSAAARGVGRSHTWVRKWLDRFDAGGVDGLTDQARTPVSQPTATPQSTVTRVLEIRGEYELRPEASIGGNSIHARMERDGFEPLPSVSTIERILSRANVTRSKRKRDRSKEVSLPLPKPTIPGVWQQADWVQDRYLTGGIRFNSLQVADVGSHGIAAGQFHNRRIVTAVRFLLEHAWPKLSIPQALSVDNMFVKTTHPNNPFTNWVKACLWFGTEVIINPPASHGWNNHVEAVNNEWQNRTIRAQWYATIEDLRHGSQRAVTWLNTKRPILDPATCGTRYPAIYIDAMHSDLRWPPLITITDHLDNAGTLHIPLANGRVTFLRHVATGHTIEIANTRWAIPPSIPTGALVTATITTGNQQLDIRHRGEPVTSHPYPINRPIIDPHYPPANSSLMRHI